MSWLEILGICIGIYLLISFTILIFTGDAGKSFGWIFYIIEVLDIDDFM